MSRDALRGATWVLAAGLGVHGVAGVLRALGTGALALMPTAALPVTVSTAVLVLGAKVAVAAFVLSRLAKDAEAKGPPWLAVVLLITLGLTGTVFSLGSGWANAFLISRAMDMGSLADFSITQSIVAAVGNVLHPLIDVGTLVAAAWLWQSRSEPSTEPPATLSTEP